MCNLVVLVHVASHCLCVSFLWIPCVFPQINSFECIFISQGLNLKVDQKFSQRHLSGRTARRYSVLHTVLAIGIYAAMQHAPFTPRQQHFWHPRQLAENSAVLPEGADPCVYFGSNATVDQYGCPCRTEGSSESAAETFLVIFGIGIHIIGSIGINTGQNLQAMGLAKLDQADRQKCGKLIRSRLWLIGCSLFISCSIVNFAALTLAPASILVPLEAVQFIVNVAFGKYVRKVEVPMRMLAGVLSMVAG